MDIYNSKFFVRFQPLQRAWGVEEDRIFTISNDSGSHSHESGWEIFNLCTNFDLDTAWTSEEYEKLTVVVP